MMEAVKVAVERRGSQAKARTERRQASKRLDGKASAKSETSMHGYVTICCASYIARHQSKSSSSKEPPQRPQRPNPSSVVFPSLLCVDSTHSVTQSSSTPRTSRNIDERGCGAKADIRVPVPSHPSEEAVALSVKDDMMPVHASILWDSALVTELAAIGFG